MYMYMVLVSFHIDHQGSEINKNNIFLHLGICLIQKLSSNYTFNKFTSWYHSPCVRLLSTHWSCTS